MDNFVNCLTIVFGFCDVFVAGLPCAKGRGGFIGGVASLSLIVTLRQQAVAASVSIQPQAQSNFQVYSNTFIANDAPIKSRFGTCSFSNEVLLFFPFAGIIPGVNSEEDE